MGGTGVSTKKQLWPMVNDIKDHSAEKVVKVWGDTPRELIEAAMKVHNIDGSKN